MAANNTDMYLSIDFKKHRIRLPKHLLHKLGDPLYVQLLVDPESRLVAVRALSRTTARDQSHKVPKSTLQSDHSVELYSMSLVQQIARIMDIDDIFCTYRIRGRLVADKSAAVFDLQTIEPALTGGTADDKSES